MAISIRSSFAFDLAATLRLRRQPPSVAEDSGLIFKALERTAASRGYHVLAAPVGARRDRPEDLAIGRLIARLAPGMELILALNATVDGQTTAHYIADRAAQTGATVSRLAQGAGSAASSTTSTAAR